MLIFIGSALFTAGVAQKSWSLMLIGWTFFGLDGENIQVADSTMLTVYFAGKEIALAFSLTLSAGPAGIAMSNIVRAAILENSYIALFHRATEQLYAIVPGLSEQHELSCKLPEW